MRALGAVALLGSTLGLAACSPQEAKPQFKGVDVSGAQYATDIPLKDADGKPRSIHDFAGKVAAVFFGYTQCPDVCPTTLQELAEVKQQLGADGDKLVAIFVTLDPERDTPEVLKAYVGNFDASFVGLHGSPDEVAAVAKDFKIFYKKVEGKTPGTYTLDHSAGTYLYDPKGNLRVYERYGTPPDALVHDVKTLLQARS